MADQPPEVEVNLTAEADAISVVFGKAPDAWVEADMARMVEYYRKMRKEFDAKPEKAKRTAAEKTPKKDLKGLDADNLLSNLGLFGA